MKNLKSIIIISFCTFLCGLGLGYELSHDKSASETEVIQKTVMLASQKKQVKEKMRELSHEVSRPDGSNIQHEGYTQISKIKAKIKKIKDIESPENYLNLIKLYKEILEIDERSVNALSNIAYNYGRLENFEQETYFLEKCIEYHPQDDFCNSSRAITAFYNSAHEDARVIVDECIARSSSHSGCHFYQAKLDIRENKFEKAIEYFEDQLSDNPRTPRELEFSLIYFELAEIHRTIGDTSQTQFYFSKACGAGFKSACELIAK